MKKLLAIFLSCASCALSGVALADEVTALKAKVCAQCHGDAGNTPIANYPKIAGQDEKYLLYTLRAYKSGKRNNAVMAAQLAAFTDSDLADFAAYFAAQEGDLRH